MRRRLACLAFLIWPALLWAQAGVGIVEVLARSQTQRLESLALADPQGAQAQTVRASFQYLLQNLAPGRPVELRVIRGDTVAEALRGSVVVANEDLANLPEGERQFILAHELGHLMLEHGAQMGRIYQKWIPGPVVPENTDAVSALLGREASQLAYQQEFEADAFAARLLRGLGWSGDELLATFIRMGNYADTPTHPSARKRLAVLRSLALVDGP